MQARRGAGGGDGLGLAGMEALGVHARARGGGELEGVGLAVKGRGGPGRDGDGDGSGLDGQVGGGTCGDAHLDRLALQRQRAADRGAGGGGHGVRSGHAHAGLDGDLSAPAVLGRDAHAAIVHLRDDVLGVDALEIELHVWLVGLADLDPHASLGAQGLEVGQVAVHGGGERGGGEQQGEGRHGSAPGAPAVRDPEPESFIGISRPQRGPCLGRRMR
jgi:hypothetical protein